MLMKYKKSISYIHKLFDTGDKIKKNIEKFFTRYMLIEFQHTNVNKNSQFPPTDTKK